MKNADVPEISGPFILLIEGLDGSGKTTLARQLEDEVTRRQISVDRTGVFLTRVGQDIRNIFMESRDVPLTSTVELLLLAAASEHLHRSVRRSQAQLVVVDRSIITTVVYHGFGLSIGEHVVESALRPALNSLRYHLCILLDLPPDQSIERARDSDRIELIRGGFRERVRDGYTKLAGQHPGIETINAMQSEEAVLLEALSALNRFGLFDTRIRELHKWT
jgi:dTMP kinase